MKKNYKTYLNYYFKFEEIKKELHLFFDDNHLGVVHFYIIERGHNTIYFLGKEGQVIYSINSKKIKNNLKCFFDNRKNLETNEWEGNFFYTYVLTFKKEWLYESSKKYYEKY